MNRYQRAETLNSAVSGLLSRTRRQFFRDCGVGVGKVALAQLALQGSLRSSFGAAPSAPMSPARVKRVIYLFMAGAPSQLDLFDEKPKLRELEGQPIPPSVIQGQRYAFIQPDAAVLGPQFDFATHGDSGARISNQLPHLANVVDELAFARSVHTDQFNHAPAQIFFNTGSGLPGRPSIGSWLSYGIGSDASDLPGFVVLKSGGSLSGGAAMWDSGFLSSEHQGVPFRSSGDPILHVSNPPGIDRQAQRDSLDLIGSLNRRHFESTLDPEILSRAQAYETAFRMQERAPELTHLGSESQETLSLYGVDPQAGFGSYASQCLLARRLVERGVRFVQVYNAGWDHHSNVAGGIRGKARETDQATAALIIDLKRRGLLDDTLVIWGGEFGRTPMVEASAALGRTQGRDHHPQAFTMWFAGAGIRKGAQIGRTDELGFHIEERPIHVHDVQATLLHLMGLDHERLTYRFQGRDFRLTDVGGRVIGELLA